MDSENPPAQFRGGADQSPHLPLDIIEQILAILPVKSLLRFRCVSKSWHRLIGSDRFIKIHLQKSRYDRSFTHRRVIFNYLEAGLKQCSMRSYLDEASIDPSPIEDPTNSKHRISGTVVGSINGVLCILKKPGYFSLYNPSTRIFYELPKIEKAIQTHGFGWDETCDAYKVFAVMLDSHNNRIGQLYSSKTNSWKTVAHGSFLSSGNEAGVFSSGKIYWFSDDRLHIKSFDLKSEVFGNIELPCKPEVGVRMWLSEKMGCIGVIVDRKGTSLIDVWILKESWVKKVMDSPFPQRKITDRYRTHFYIESLVSPIQEQNQKNLWRGSGNKTKFSKFIKKLKQNTIYTCYSPSS